MPDQHIQVFVSCPGDATPEKNIVKRVVSSVNNTLIQLKSNYRFEVLDFGNITAEYHGRPQEDINRLFSDYDIYLGLMWMRFGTASGASDPDTGKSYDSGTEEEFRIAHRLKKLGKRVKIYFFFKDSIGTRNSTESKQLLKVQEFKEEIQHFGWVHTFPNNDDIHFNNKIYEILHAHVSEVGHDERSIHKAEFITSIEEKRKTVDIKSLIKGAIKFQLGIPRTLTAFIDKKQQINSFFRINEGKTLPELVTLQKHLIVLGGAGAGKSTELSNLIYHYSNEDSEFIPIYQRLNTYVDQPLEDFLPEGWKELPQSVALVVLDGLDEVQPKHFSTAVRQILNFSEKFPEARIVVSCRTNFYDFPVKNNGGTLAGFEVYILDDISDARVDAYVSEKLEGQGKAFIIQAEANGFIDLIKQPFFLQILLKQFSSSKNLEVDRATLLNTFIEQRMEFDEEHFQLTHHDLKDKRTEIMQLMRRVALTMEYMGKNYIMMKDLHKVLPEAEELKLIKCSTAFGNSESEPDKWGFEHNNIQEFLAASALKDLDIEQIKKFISFRGTIIKPTWINTIFFLISIVEQEKRRTLIQWVLSIDPDVLVKVEPDKIDKGTRKQVFIQIFEHYKQQGVWLNSNKFTTRELANFADSDDVFKYLNADVLAIENNRITKLNAVRLLKYLKLDKLQSERVKALLYEYVCKERDDTYIFFLVAETIATLELADLQLVKSLMDTFGTNDNQYIRSGFYQMIIQAQLQNEFIDYLLAGVHISEEAVGRDKIHLWDEDYLLQTAFEQSLGYPALLHVLERLKVASDAELHAFREKNDVTKGIIANAIEHHELHPQVLADMINIYHLSTKLYEDFFTDTILEFFSKTGTKLVLFKDVFHHSDFSTFEKNQLFKKLITKEAVDYLMDEYEQHNLTRRDLLEFYESVQWFGRQQKSEEIDYMVLQFKKRTNLLKNLPKAIDYQKVRQEKEQENINLYFSNVELEAAVLSFFDERNIQVLDWDEVWLERRKNYDPAEIHNAAHDLLVAFTRGGAKVSIEQITNFFQDETAVENLAFTKLRDKLTQNSQLNISSAQLQKLQQWANDRSWTNDVTQGFREPSPGKYTQNKLIGHIWYYISKFGIQIDESKLLDFTTYSEPGGRNEVTLDFEIIEKQTGAKKLAERVLANLKDGSLSDEPWLNNAYYAIDKQVSSAYNSLRDEIINSKRSEYIRRKVLQRYAKQTGDRIGILSILKSIGHDHLRWDIVKLLLNDFTPTTQVEEILIKILRTDSESLKERFAASKYLTQIGNVEGTEFFTSIIMKGEDELKIDYYNDGAYLRFIKESRLINKLITLLVYANQPEQKIDDFNRLDNFVTEGLLNIGAQSEENMLLVKEAMERFIIENTGEIDHVNFYYPLIERMEFNFYIGQTRKVTVEEAVSEIKKLE